jgi:hypothetical protein
MTWDEYKAWVSDLVKVKGSYFCRGHANENWKLQTSFHREAVHKKITLTQYLEIILPEIHYHISGILNDFTDLRIEYEFGAFLALIQHHGFPTPLLDWTLSPYMAAYFAFREVNEIHPLSNNIKIYMFDYNEWAKSFKQPLDLKDTTTEFVSIIRPFAKFNPRIIAQQGIFTLTNVDDMELYINSRANETKKNFLYSVLLSVKEKPNVMRELNLMGINEMTLFPGLEGICRSLKSQFFSPDTVGLTPKDWEEFFSKPEPKAINYLLNLLELKGLLNFGEPKTLADLLGGVKPESDSKNKLESRMRLKDYLSKNSTEK